MAIAQNKVRVQVILDNKTHDELKSEAEKKGLSVSALIRMLILEREK